MQDWAEYRMTGKLQQRTLTSSNCIRRLQTDQKSNCSLIWHRALAISWSVGQQAHDEVEAD
jgi:hypothetical protein